MAYTVIWWAILAILLFVPPLILWRLFRANWIWFALGIAGYLLGMTAKGILYFAGQALNLSTIPVMPQAMVVGISSAMTELAAAALFLAWGRRRLGDVLAFGVGVGLFEIFVAMMAGWDEITTTTKTHTSFSEFAHAVAFSFLVERGITLIGHTTSRALVYVFFRTRSRSLPAQVPSLILLVRSADYSGRRICGMAGWA